MKIKVSYNGKKPDAVYSTDDGVVEFGNFYIHLDDMIRLCEVFRLARKALEGKECSENQIAE